MIRQPPKSTPTDTPFTNTTLFRTRPNPNRRCALHNPNIPQGSHPLRRKLECPEPQSPRRRGPGSRKYYTMPNERSEEHTSELQSLMRISYAVFCLKQIPNATTQIINTQLYVITLLH